MEPLNFFSIVNLWLFASRFSYTWLTKYNLNPKVWPKFYAFPTSRNLLL